MSKEQGSESAVSRSQSIKEEEMAEEKEAPRKVSRRGFVKGAAAVAGAGALASCAPAATPAPTTAPEATATTAPAAAPTPAPEKWDYETDIVVAGSGNGGLSAAIAAAEEGAKVIVVEVSSTTGGGSAYSGGFIHCVGIGTYDDYLKWTDGMHDPVLGRVYFENWVKYSSWLGEIDAYVSPPYQSYDRMMGKGEPWPERCRLYFDSLERIFEEAGGTLLLNTAATKILTGDEGEVLGLRAKGPEGMLDIKAKAVILATGGFQGNSEFRQKFYGPYGDLASVYGVPYHTGAGMVMAQEVGASLSDCMAHFAAVSSPAHPFGHFHEDAEEYEKRPYTVAGKGELANLFFVVPREHIYVNLAGERFVDEGERSYRIEQGIMRQFEAKAFSIFDDAIWSKRKDELTWTGVSTAKDTLDTCVRWGATLVTADTMDEFANKLAELRVHKANFLKTIEEYNAALDAGTTAELQVARTGQLADVETPVPQAGDLVKIETPPFYAFPVTPWVYSCAGGVAINKDAQVLDIDKRPIAGLYAVPPTAGGIMREVYTGGIATAGTFGWIAGKHAAGL